MIMEKKLRVRDSVKADLKKRKEKKQKKPSFKRQEQDFQNCLKEGWRRPRGKHSKLRMKEKARGRLPAPGYGSPASVRGLNRLGYREVIVSNTRDVGSLNHKEEMAVISSGVGKRKREEIIKVAKEKKVHISNA